MRNRIITALAATVLAVPAMAAPAAGYFQVPGTETTLKIYGFAQVDGVYDIDGNYGMDGGIGSIGIKDEDAELSNQWHWRSKGRFGFTSTTPSSLGDVVMKIEYQGQDNKLPPAYKGLLLAADYANGVTLRHCFGKIGNLTIGKTDSIFADWDASPNYMDNDGVLADFYGNGRVNQVSYSFEPTQGVTLQFGVERDTTGSNDRYFPGALVAALGYTADWGHVRGSVAFAKHKHAATPAYQTSVLNPDGTVTTTDHNATADASKSQVNFGLGANYVIGKGNITAQLLQGVGFYGVDVFDGYALLDENGDDIDETIKTQKVLGMTLGYSHAVTDAVTVATGFGSAKWKKDKDLLPATITINNFFVNAQWQATKTASFGAEYFMGDAKVTGGEKYKESRINLRAKFNMF